MQEEKKWKEEESVVGVLDDFQKYDKEQERPYITCGPRDTFTTWYTYLIKMNGEEKIEEVKWWYLETEHFTVVDEIDEKRLLVTRSSPRMTPIKIFAEKEKEGLEKRRCFPGKHEEIHEIMEDARLLQTIYPPATIYYVIKTLPFQCISIPSSI